MKRRPSDLRRNTSCLQRTLVLVVFVAAASVSLAIRPTRADAMSAPDSARIVWVAFQLRHFDDTRIVTGSGKITARRPTASSDGLLLAREQQGPGITASWDPPKERLVPWGEIESIQGRKGGHGTGIAIGALAGLTFGLLYSWGDALRPRDHARYVAAKKFGRANSAGHGGRGDARRAGQSAGAVGAGVAVRHTDLSRNFRPPGRPCLLAIIVAAGVSFACPTPTFADIPAAPDSTRLAWVAFQIRHFDDVRVVTGGKKLMVHNPAISSDGLHLLKERRAGQGITAPLTPPEEQLVPWTEIESIHGRKGRGSGIVVGALVGLSVGLVIAVGQAAASVLTLGASQPSGKPMLIAVLGGAALGSLANPPGRWEPVYP